MGIARFLCKLFCQFHPTIQHLQNDPEIPVENLFEWYRLRAISIKLVPKFSNQVHSSVSYNLPYAFVRPILDGQAPKEDTAASCYESSTQIFLDGKKTFYYKRLTRLEYPSSYQEIHRHYQNLQYPSLIIDGQKWVIPQFGDLHTLVFLGLFVR